MDGLEARNCRVCFICILVGFFLLTVSLSVRAECWLEDKKTGRQFRIFNALLYKELPNLSEYCIEPINVMYAWEFFPRGYKKGDLQMPEKLHLRNAITKAGQKKLITVIDIEHWPLKNVDKVVLGKSINNYLDVVASFKEMLPDSIVGYYGIVPTVDFSRSKSFKKGRRYKQWTKENDRVLPIASEVDALFPSLYTINSNRYSWIGRAKAHISESARLAHGKPIYPFIWPNYHEQGGKYPNGTELEPDYWRLQLNFLKNNADGIVLWGGNKQVWNEDMQWWKELTKFIQGSFIVRNKP